MLLLAAAPLLIYPFILIANIMSFAGTPSSTPPPILATLTSMAFLWASTLYPLIYFPCLIAAIATARTNPSRSLQLAAAPLAYLGLCIMLFFLWMLTS